MYFKYIVVYLFFNVVLMHDASDIKIVLMC